MGSPRITHSTTAIFGEQIILSSILSSIPNSTSKFDDVVSYLFLNHSSERAAFAVKEMEKFEGGNEFKVLISSHPDKQVSSHDFSIEKLLLKSNGRSQESYSNCSGRGMKRCEEVTQHVKQSPSSSSLSSNPFTQIMTFSSSLEGAAASIRGMKKSSLSSPYTSFEQVTSKLYLSLSPPQLISRYNYSLLLMSFCVRQVIFLPFLLYTLWYIEEEYKRKGRDDDDVATTTATPQILMMLLLNGDLLNYITPENGYNLLSRIKRILPSLTTHGETSFPLLFHNFCSFT